MSDICNKIIENGITHNSAQYSLDVYDQIMISELRQMAVNGNIVKYHANKSECRIYEAEEFLSLANTAAAYIDFHRTYFNRLRSDINDMTDINDVISVQYGQELSEKRNNEFITLMNGVTFDFVEIIDDTNYDYFCYDINTDNLITLENTQEKNR